MQCPTLQSRTDKTLITVLALYAQREIKWKSGIETGHKREKRKEKRNGKNDRVMEPIPARRHIFLQAAIFCPALFHVAPTTELNAQLTPLLGSHSLSVPILYLHDCPLYCFQCVLAKTLFTQCLDLIL